MASLSTLLPFTLVINLIWNEYYRDQDLQNSRPVPTNDGPDDLEANLYQILPSRNKRKDYFTSARPWPQKGPAVVIPSIVSSTITGSGNITLPAQTISRANNAPTWIARQSGTNTAINSASAWDY